MSSKSRRNRRMQQIAASNTKVPQTAVDAKQEPVKGFDMFSNIMARLGVGSNNLLEGTSYPLTRLTRNYMLMQSLYRSSWIMQRIADTYPEHMCKIPPELTCQVSPKELDAFYRVVAKTGVWRKLEWSLKLANIFGGAGALMIIKGHENFLDEPLDLEDIKPDSFRGIIPFDRWSGINPNALICNDIDRPLDYGLPETYLVTTAQAGAFSVHSSRVLRFTGRDLPLWEQQTEMYWGESIFESVYEELKKRDNTSFNIVSLMFRAQIMGLKVPELAQMLSGIGASQEALQQFMRTLQTQSDLMSNQGLAVLGEDGGLESHQYTFGGVADVYREFAKDLSAAAEIPYELTFGRDAGLGDNGEGSLQVFYDRVSHKQMTKLDPALEKLYPVIAMSAWGEVPKDFAWKFPIARTMSMKEKAELAEALTKPVIDSFNAGLIPQRTALMEFQRTASDTGVFSHITDEEIAKADDTVNKSAEDGGFGNVFGGEEEKKPSKGADSAFEIPEETFDSVTAMQEYHDLPVVVETPKGQKRRGDYWRRTMPADYGYIIGYFGADGDEMDCYIGPNPESDTAYVVDQRRIGSEEFDEHKCMLGYSSLREATDAYLAGHTNGDQIFLGITPLKMDRFKRWLRHGNHSVPYYEPMGISANDAEWVESEHPRDEEGKFSDKEGRSASSPKSEYEEAMASIEETLSSSITPIDVEREAESIKSKWPSLKNYEIRNMIENKKNNAEYERSKKRQELVKDYVQDLYDSSEEKRHSDKPLVVYRYSSAKNIREMQNEITHGASKDFGTGRVFEGLSCVVAPDQDFNTLEFINPREFPPNAKFTGIRPDSGVGSASSAEAIVRTGGARDKRELYRITVRWRDIAGPSDRIRPDGGIDIDGMILRKGTKAQKIERV